MLEAVTIREALLVLGQVEAREGTAEGIALVRCVLLRAPDLEVYARALAALPD